MGMQKLLHLTEDYELDLEYFNKYHYTHVNCLLIFLDIKINIFHGWGFNLEGGEWLRKEQKH